MNNINDLNGMMAVNAWPFILAAYGAGFVFIAGYAAWAWHERRRLQKILAVLRAPSAGKLI